MSTLSVLILALLIDALIGDPPWLWKRVPHPVSLIGKAIGAGDRLLNTGPSAGSRRAKGAALVVTLVAWSVVFGLLIEFLPYAGTWVAIVVSAVLLAQRSLSDHVWAVAAALKDDLTAGRRAVSQIVGRDTAALSEAEVSRAAIESAAENFSDGVVAPVFWFIVGGLPGLIAYKAVNTADSMIGHKTPRHEAFGWAAARLDDVMNFIPARLSALLLLAAGWAFEQSDMVMRDAPQHRSWNAGWPEAAMAGVLGVAVSGPRAYHGTRTDEPWLNEAGRKDPGPDDIEAAVMLLWRAWTIMLIALCVLAFLT